MLKQIIILLLLSNMVYADRIPVVILDNTQNISYKDNCVKGEYCQYLDFKTPYKELFTLKYIGYLTFGLLCSMIIFYYIVNFGINKLNLK